MRLLSGIVLSILLLSNLYGQSSTTTKPAAQTSQASADSADTVNEFLQLYAKPTLDSLIRYKYSKLNYALLEKDLSDCQTQKAGLIVERNRFRSDANVFAEKYAKAEQLVEVKIKTVRSARMENWIWRIGAGIIVYSLVRTYVFK